MTKPIFQHILIPLDFTAKNRAAAEMALQLAVQNHARVTLLHVVEAIDYAEDEETARFYDSLTREAVRRLSEFAEPFLEAGVPVREEVILDKRGPGIVAFAAENDVDLIVLSSHRVDWKEAPKSWATLSYQVAVLCPCPVLLVK